MQNRRSLIGGLLAFAGIGAKRVASAATPIDAGNQLGLLFIQQDMVLSFPPTGDGVRAGTATGRINGTTIQNFQFQPVPPPAFASDDLCIISDIDGDQVIFRAQVTGRFLAPPLGVANNPLGNLFAAGGPFSGTYTVVAASGKYGYLMGRVFPCKGLGSNPAKGNQLGSVYVEVYLDHFDDRAI